MFKSVGFFFNIKKVINKYLKDITRQNLLQHITTCAEPHPFKAMTYTLKFYLSQWACSHYTYGDDLNTFQHY